ncbi:MAG TPA: thiamine pyrophosphate-dependent enzyme, partial [Longimicrobiaceae bacterium]|nr:thiamine pyrophosphate-dependent enzyme [Longimicrobiaceae bacterium]
GADLDAAARGAGHVEVEIDPPKAERLGLVTATLNALRDLRWRYVEGPSGRGRAPMGIANSTGCSSVWASTYPYNPYPFPWVNHLFQDAPSIAIGLFEGHMRKMADNFIQVRRAEKLLAGEYDVAADEPFFAAFDWHQFDDEEFALCPPILTIGGDGAMLDIGFQNLSRLLASGKPIRVMVLDTQVYSNTGGQASTATFTSQAADMSPFGKEHQGKEETRKELALIAIAHRGAFVLQSSQSSPSHLIGGVIRGLNSHRPAIFNIYTPCPVEHGLPDEWAPTAAKLALESRAFPHLIYDPDAGRTVADCLSLEGNPATEDTWPTYSLEYVDGEGQPASMELPLTIADWAATEARFKKHFRPVARDAGDELVPFHEFVEMSSEDREGRTPFIYTIAKDRTLARLQVSPHVVKLAEDRLLFWSQLRELAGVRVAPSVRDGIAAELEEEFDRKMDALRAEHEGKMSELRITYPALVARRMADALLQAGDGTQTVADLLARADATPGLRPISAAPLKTPLGTATRLAMSGVAISSVGGVPGVPEVAAEPAGSPRSISPNGAAIAGTAIAAPGPNEAAHAGPATGTPGPNGAAPVATIAEEDDLAMEPYIDTDRCTTCNDCINLNGKMFGYNANKQAYIKDARAGTFRDLVLAAEKCPAELIHPGTPLNPKEKDLAKWVERAKRFN